jgi:putative SOS response-associated peptidase YedK
MCCDYDLLTDAGGLQAAFGVAVPEAGDAAASEPDGPPIFIVASLRPELGVWGEVRRGEFGLPSGPARQDGFGVTARECRVETMKSDPRCRESWWAGRRCIVPVDRLIAWCHDTGAPQAWGIRCAQGQPLALAGLFNELPGPEGQRCASFAVLTLPAVGHAVFGRMGHPMAQDPRMPALLSAAAQRQWLYGSWAEAQRLLQPCAAASLQVTPLPAAEAAAWASPPVFGLPDLFGDLVSLPGPVRGPGQRPRRAMPARSARAAVPVTADLFA